MTSLVRMVDPSAPALPPDSPRGWVALLDSAVELAKFIGGTEFVPRTYRNNPAAMTAAILYGDEIGFGPMQSLNSVVMVEGSPSLYAKAQRALVLAAGHSIWPEELTTTRCTWAAHRRGEADKISRVSWTMEDARRANLAGRKAYREYPRQMLSARSSAELCGAIFSDVTAGLPAFEEFDGGVADVDVLAPNSGATGTRRRQRGGKTATAGVTAAPRMTAASLPPLPGDSGASEVTTEGDSQLSDEPARMMTEAQRKRMHGLFGQRGVTDRGDRLRYTSAVIGRVVVTAKELTAEEADLLLTALELDRAPEPDEPGPDYEPPLPLDEQT
jgi:hypothetical protein